MQLLQLDPRADYYVQRLQDQAFYKRQHIGSVIGVITTHQNRNFRLDIDEHSAHNTALAREGFAAAAPQATSNVRSVEPLS